MKIIGTWKDVKNSSRTTVGKIHTEKEPTKDFIKKSLISEHSIIRLIQVNWIWENIKSWISVHFSRSKWECFISTQRSDRTNIDRDKSTQDTPVNFEGLANAQHLIDTSRKRLCFASHKETVEYMCDLKKEIKWEGEKELSDVLVPNGIYRCGCPEFINCGRCDKILETLLKEDLMNIQKRYDAFNKVFDEGGWK